MSGELQARKWKGSNTRLDSLLRCTWHYDSLQTHREGDGQAEDVGDHDATKVCALLHHAFGGQEGRPQRPRWWLRCLHWLLMPSLLHLRFPREQSTHDNLSALRALTRQVPEATNNCGCCTPQAMLGQWSEYVVMAVSRCDGSGTNGVQYLEVIPMIVLRVGDIVEGGLGGGYSRVRRLRAGRICLRARSRAVLARSVTSWDSDAGWRVG